MTRKWTHDPTAIEVRLLAYRDRRSVAASNGHRAGRLKRERLRRWLRALWPSVETAPETVGMRRGRWM